MNGEALSVMGHSADSHATLTSHSDLHFLQRMDPHRRLGAVAVGVEVGKFAEKDRSKTPWMEAWAGLSQNVGASLEGER